MVKFKLMLNKDKETEYLNEMARQGYALTGFFAGFYTFDNCRPGEYIYQIDITEGMFQVSNNYREFMTEMGVEIICLWGPWVILRKKAAEGPFELYTDVESTIEHYQKIKKMFKIATIIEIICIAMQLISAVKLKEKGEMVLSLGLACLLAVFPLFFFREIARVEGILQELRERIGMESARNAWTGKGRLSGFFSLGLILNGIGFLIPQMEGSGWLSMVQEPAEEAFHLLALIFMIVGLVLTIRGHRE